MKWWAYFACILEILETKYKALEKFLLEAVAFRPTGFTFVHPEENVREMLEKHFF